MRVQFLLEVCLSPSWLVVWQLCWYSHRSPFTLQNTGESFLYYLNALRIESVLVMLFTDPKNMLGFKFNLYMSPCFGGSWIALTLCISSHAVMWFCHMLSLESQFHDSPVCISSNQSFIHWLLPVLVLCWYLYPLLCLGKQTLWPPWGMFLQHNAKFELLDLRGYAKHFEEVLERLRWAGRVENSYPDRGLRCFFWSVRRFHSGTTQR